MSKDPVVKVIVDVIIRYDICAVQEVCDKDGVAVYDLLKELNDKTNGKYSLQLGPRVGNTYRDTEQYAFYYRHDVVTVLGNYTYSDPNNVFARDPYMVYFSTTESVLKRFVFGAIHTRPKHAVSEIDHLTKVNADAKEQFQDENVLIGGDYNADCAYVKEHDWKEISYRTMPIFTWLIDDDAKTNLARTSSCAYDRLVTHGQGFRDAYLPGSAKVFYYDQDLYDTPMNRTLALAVSDHYPVEMSIKDPNRIQPL
ncbi:deoxyribonuclease-1-like 2 [Saccoglossus kowalevskii]|uniref:Deoxyribonuclease-1-like 2-like n=1 Tax=Saccoglossus kowalevskii TaxID=10224 RepID=A0ABM0MPR3_SACKO|nr:PREDICTED: deoxyribonuclease-1-like 2-like [Saccoglossus kowalevskii]